jgi:hypothetical protein
MTYKLPEPAYARGSGDLPAYHKDQMQAAYQQGRDSMAADLKLSGDQNTADRTEFESWKEDANTTIERLEAENAAGRKEALEDAAKVCEDPIFGWASCARIRRSMK